MNFTIWNVINFTCLALGAFIPFMSVFVLMHAGKWRLLPNRLLALYLAGMGMTCATSFIIQTGLILQIPWFFRLPSPLYYLMFPAGFLYVKTLLKDKNRLSRVDYLHFLPALLHFFEMLPYYLKSNEYKLIHVTESVNNPFGAFTHNEGWLPSYMHNIIRGFLGMIYGVWILYILVKFRQRHPGMSKWYPGLSRWLWVFGTMMFIFGLVVTYTLILGRWDNPQNRALFMTIVFSTTQIITGFVLFMHPAYLYGMPRLSGFNELKNIPVESPGSIPQVSGNMDSETPILEIEQTEKFSNEDALLMEIYQAYKEKLEILMNEKQPYLKEHYKVADLARDLGIPQHHVTILLNRILNIRFNDYINHYRIQHIKLLIEKNGLSHTLEGFANMAGFSNRTTFIRAVQRITGHSPSQYFQVKK